jgi:hypothetical protein
MDIATLLTANKLYPLQQLKFKIKRLWRNRNNYNIRCESNEIIILAKRGSANKGANKQRSKQR